MLKTSSWLLVSSLTVSGWAVQFLDNRPGRGGAFAFIEDFSGPRETALARTGVSLQSSDPLFALLNPASTWSPDSEQRIAAAWQTGTLDQQQFLLAWRFPYRLARLQALYAANTYTPIAGQDEFGNPTGAEYNPFNQMFSMTAQIPTHHFRIGWTLKIIADHLSDDPGDQTALGWGMDYGMQWRQTSPRWGLGIAVRNLGNQVRSYRTAAAYQAEGINPLNYMPLNTSIQIGGHWNMAYPRGMSWALDWEMQRYAPMNLHAAWLYTPNLWLELRAGIQRTIPELAYTFKMFFPKAERVSGNWNRLNGGLGIHLERWDLDYAISVLYSIDLRHQIGLRYRF